MKMQHIVIEMKGNESTITKTRIQTMNQCDVHEGKRLYAMRASTSCLYSGSVRGGSRSRRIPGIWSQNVFGGENLFIEGDPLGNKSSLLRASSKHLGLASMWVRSLTMRVYAAPQFRCGHLYLQPKCSVNMCRSRSPLAE